MSLLTKKVRCDADRVITQSADVNSFIATGNMWSVLGKYCITPPRGRRQHSVCEVTNLSPKSHRII